MEPQWQILLLGGLEAEHTSGPTLTRFRTQKTGGLLAYLAYHRQRTHLRDELVEVLWPESDPQAGRNSLKTALSWLRRQLDPVAGTDGPVLTADRISVRLCPQAVTTDVAQFEAALEAAVRAESSEA